jgi:hypothetical protein
MCELILVCLCVYVCDVSLFCLVRMRGPVLYVIGRRQKVFACMPLVWACVRTYILEHVYIRIVQASLNVFHFEIPTR